MSGEGPYDGRRQESFGGEGSSRSGQGEHSTGRIGYYTGPEGMIFMTDDQEPQHDKGARRRSRDRARAAKEREHLKQPLEGPKAEAERAEKINARSRRHQECQNKRRQELVNDDGKRKQWRKNKHGSETGLRWKDGNREVSADLTTTVSLRLIGKLGIGTMSSSSRGRLMGV